MLLDAVQVKKKVDAAADGRGRFKSKSDAPLRKSDASNLPPGSVSILAAGCCDH